MEKQQADGGNNQGTLGPSIQIVPSGEQVAKAEKWIQQAILETQGRLQREQSRNAPKHITEGLASRLQSLKEQTAVGLATRELQREQDQAAEQERNEQRQRFASWENFLTHMPRYREATLATYESTTAAQSAAVESLRAYCLDLEENVKQCIGIVCIGPSGTGKDHLLAAVMRAAILHNNKKCCWTSGPELYQDMRDSIDSDTSEDRQLSKFVFADILTISDPALRGHPLTAFQSDVFYRVIDRRYNSMRPTFISANVKNRAELESLIGVAVVDRLTDSALVINCDWPSYRKPRKTKE